ncbi:alpha/beta fold hydrolase [Pseudidiomarina sediminum]|uniref:alpha/beta fold hydrolase n=1 Tax=Pseudidiomarina sediminum TaxID=431675 RepID=UPI0003F72586|nr:alpha/beta fold hydrolase [Pseudidiomarina sediminum]
MQPLASKPSDAQTKAWQAFYRDTVFPFWQHHVERFELVRPHELTLRYFLIRPAGAKAVVLVSPGRIEGAIKYPELVWDLCQQGYAVAILDHRGQGFSDRLSANPHHGHVHHFSDFVDDFAAFVRAIEQQTLEHYGSALPLHVLAHSMGSAIAALYLARYPHKVKNAVLCSPMFGIQTGAVPTWLAAAVAHTGAVLNRLLSPKQPWYIVGSGDYAEVPFVENDLTHSSARYVMFREHYQQHPEVQLGGPSFRWVAQALTACKQAIAEAGNIHIPVLVLQAGHDVIVAPHAQQEFVCALSHPYSQLVRIDKAKHELLIEADDYRTPTVTQALAWFRGEQGPPTMGPCE